MDLLRSYAAQRLLPQPASGGGDVSAETEVLNIFGGGQFVDFVHARQRNLTLDDLNRLRVFPFLDDQSNIYDLHHELRKYQANAKDVDSGYSEALFWADKTELPHWFAVWRSLALIQPSSAMVERAFSHLRSTISDNQHLALQ